MSCCGKKREIWRGKSPQLPKAPSGNPGAVYFRYLGNKALTVAGTVTGRVYQFWGSGAAAAADPRDAPALAAVPHLTQISKP
jgi:hypothetical protein